MSNDKTLGHAVRYEWFSASEQWSACDHSEAKKLSAAGYEVREVRGFRMDCTCPSGDGSLRHPCPAHPATLATVKHGGCVQLPSTAAHVLVNAEHLERVLVCAEGSHFDDCMADKNTTMTQAIEQMRGALAAQPSPGGQGDAREIIEEFLQCAASGRPHGKLIAQAKDYLAARQPVGQERVAWASTGATGHKVVAMPGLHKLPCGDYDLYAAPPAQAVDRGMQQDAARWRAIAPHLSVEWDEDEMLKRWTWIDFKGDALSVPTRTRESYACVEEAIDAVIDSQAVGNG